MKYLFYSLCMAGTILSCTNAPQLHGYDREANMDTTVAPGYDFRLYATGKFIAEHPLRDDQARNGSFIDLAENNQKQIRDLIADYTSTPQEKGTLGYKIATIYNQMMDSVTRDKEGYAPIQANLERIRAVQDRHEYQKLIAELDRRGEGLMMFGFGVGADMKDAENNLVGIGQGGLGLHTPDYYLQDGEREKKILEAYRNRCRTYLRLVGHTAEEAATMEAASFALEMQIAKVSKTTVELRDVEANYHKMPYSQLLSDFPGIDWDNILEAFHCPSISHIDVGQIEPIKEVSKIYAEADIEALKAYAEICLISGNANVLSQDFRDAAFEFKKVYNGVTVDDPRWKYATNLVSGVLGDAIGKLYCEKYFPESSKKRMLELVSNLQVALGQRIDESTWMSEETKAKAKDKLSNFIVKIGYPDQWKDYSQLSIDESLSLYENLANVSEFLFQDELDRKVNKPVDKNDWHMTPQTVNAYYNPTTNEICFPAGILQPPFFDPEATDAVNYGAIGGVIGHEMSHGFDDQGSQFDKTGNQVNWWTDADKKAFEARTQVLVDHFNSITCPTGGNINGKQTLGENIGDNGGLNIALRACQNANPNMTKEDLQDFFMSWALVWAGNVRDEFLDMQLKVDVHSPAFARVNAALPMIDAWYDAFDIKESDPLFVPKEKRARIW